MVLSFQCQGQGIVLEVDYRSLVSVGQFRSRLVHGPIT